MRSSACCIGGCTCARPSKRGSGPLIGVSTGLVTAATGVFVIPAVPYLQALGLEKDELVRALGLSFLVSTIALGASLGAGGALQVSTLLGSAMAVLPALLGMGVGQWAARARAAADVQDDVLRRAAAARCLPRAARRLAPVQLNSAAVASQRVDDDRVDARTVLRVDVREQLRAHPRLPEAAHVLREVVHRLVAVRHRGEERADAVDHADQVVVVHRSSTSIEHDAFGVRVDHQVVAARQADRAPCAARSRRLDREQRRRGDRRQQPARRRPRPSAPSRRWRGSSPR
jgi:hypothetical protein